jgi:hypothetical protein
MERGRVRVQERGEVECGRQIRRGESGLVFLLCRSEWGPARVDGSVFGGLVASFLVVRDHLSQTRPNRHSARKRIHHAGLAVPCILWSPMSLWLPRSRQLVLLRAANHRHLPLRALSHHVLSRSPSTRPSPVHLRLVRYESTSTAGSDPKPSPPTPKEDGPLLTRAWKKVKHEAQHYWHGSKLLVSEVRISSRLQWKILHGESLTRRERRQVCLRASSRCLSDQSNTHSSEEPLRICSS